MIRRMNARSNKDVDVIAEKIKMDLARDGPLLVIFATEAELYNEAPVPPLVDRQQDEMRKFREAMAERIPVEKEFKNKQKTTNGNGENHDDETEENRDESSNE